VPDAGHACKARRAKGGAAREGAAWRRESAKVRMAEGGYLGGGLGFGGCGGNGRDAAGTACTPCSVWRDTFGGILFGRRGAADCGACGLVLALEHVGVKVGDAVLFAHVVGHDLGVLQRLLRGPLLGCLQLPLVGRCDEFLTARELSFLRLEFLDGALFKQDLVFSLALLRHF
jgi:hypothetical protein